MPVPSRRLKDLIEGTVDHYASQRWPALEEVTIRWRGSYGYLTGYLSEDDHDTIPLCRIQFPQWSRSPRLADTMRARSLANSPGCGPMSCRLTAETQPAAHRRKDLPATHVAANGMRSRTASETRRAVRFT
jgi:hypothetical protein